jgi:hypothetical protein
MDPDQVRFRSGASTGVPEDVMNFAQALAVKHGAVLISREKNGLHLNLACPACLEVEGDQELRKRHLAVNADKFCATGRWEGATDHLRDSVGLCMKCGTKYKATQLMTFAPLAARGIKESKIGSVSFADNTQWLVRDALDNIVPGGPGNGPPGSRGNHGDPRDVIPINQLSADHPAVQYLLERDYDLQSLWEQFRCSYCVREWAQDPATKRYYRKLCEGFRDSPQGRIIFFADIEGVQKTWQARIIERVAEHGGTRFKYFWNGDTNTWFCMESYDVAKKKFIPPPQYAERWSPSKYRTANGTARNEILMGLDAAIAWNACHRPGQLPIAFTSEGPLDAGRLRAPAVAQIGKFLSDDQIALLARHFAVVIQVPDNDAAGQKDLELSSRRLASKVLTDVWHLPQQLPDGKAAKDIGDFPQAWVDEQRQTWLNSY